MIAFIEEVVEILWKGWAALPRWLLKQKLEEITNIEVNLSYEITRIWKASSVAFLAFTFVAS